MSKRYADPKNADGEEAYNKRQKIKHVATATEDIQSSRQLQQLLAFDQDVARAKHGKLLTPDPLPELLLIDAQASTHSNLSSMVSPMKTPNDRACPSSRTFSNRKPLKMRPTTPTPSTSKA
jgi:hypothetical protein